MLQTKAAKYICVLLLILIPVFVVTWIGRQNILIEKDSYEFLVPKKLSEDKIKTLGSNGDSYYIPAYNRIGYSSVIKSFPVKSSDSINIAVTLNIIFLTLSGLLIFTIILRITKNYPAALLSTVIFGFDASTRFVSTLVVNDLLAVFLVLSALFFITKEKSFSKKSIVLFILISTLRFEYLFLLIPIYYWIRKVNKDKKNYLHVIDALIGSFLFNVILLLPSFSTDWIKSELQITDNIQFNLLFFTGALIGFIVLFKFLRKYTWQILMFACMVISLALLFHPIYFSLFPDFVVNTLPAAVLAVLLVMIIESRKFEIFTLEGEKGFFKMSAYSIMLMFIIYKTFYFHHLIILNIFVAICLGILSAAIFRKINFRTFGSKLFGYFAFFIVLASIAVANQIVYANQYAQYNIDVAQLVSKDIQKYIDKNKVIKNSNSLIFSNFPEAVYYWTGYSSSDIKNLNSNSARPSYIIIADVKNEVQQISNYQLIETKVEDISVNYGFYEDKDVDSTKNQLFINFYKSNLL